MKTTTIRLFNSSIEKCPGVCVAERLAGFCEAILDVDSICAQKMKCCVSKQIFESGNLPPELVIPSRTEVTTTSSTPRSTPTPRAEVNKLPPGSCSGTCVTGFFALLCDEIDRKAQCPANGRCCITKKVESSERPSEPQSPKKCPGFCLPQSMSSLCTKPSNILHNTESCNKGTVCCESRTGNDVSEVRNPPKPATTPRPKPPPLPPRPQRPSGGGGPDLTSLLLNAAPTILSAATGNSDAGTTAAALLPVLGTILGSGGLGGGGGGAAPPNRNPASQAPQGGGGGGPGGLVASLLPTLVGTFLGGGGGPPNRVDRPRPPFAPPTPQPTTTTTQRTTTEKADDRSECPGTCIASYLSFTCFGKSFSNNIFWMISVF